jgi:hypothetical protein
MATLFTIGYNAWPASTRLVGMTAALTEAAVTMLVDIRHSPCPSDPTGRSAYGPKAWTLQKDGGIVDGLKAVGIKYTWILELGNPQKNDRDMKILRWQLADKEGAWPVHRGLAQLSELVGEGYTCCLLCACKTYGQCHRSLISETFCELCLGLPVRVVNLSERGQSVVFGVPG